MNKYDIRFTGTADADLFDILQYIKVDLCNPIASNELFDNISSSISKLADFPHIGSVLIYKRRKYHKLTVKNYLVLYRVDRKARTVIIERIVYARRNLKNIL